MGNAWENSKLSLVPQPNFFPHLIWLICCSSLVGGQMQDIKIQFNRHCWTLNIHRYDAWSCGCYKIRQSTLFSSRRLNNAGKPCAGLGSGKFIGWRAPECNGVKIMSSWKPAGEAPRKGWLMGEAIKVGWIWDGGIVGEDERTFQTKRDMGKGTVYITITVDQEKSDIMPLYSGNSVMQPYLQWVWWGRPCNMPIENHFISLGWGDKGLSGTEAHE